MSWQEVQPTLRPIPPPPSDAGPGRLAETGGGYGWTYRRRLAILAAAHAMAPAGPPGGDFWAAVASFELPPYPCDQGYRWFRLRATLGLVRRP